jgi:hypothetical protein
MAGRRVELTSELQKQILSYLRAGVYLRVAVAAAGVPWRIFARWMARGRQRGRPTRFHAFRAAVRQATAQARARAEVEVHEKSPLMWLKHGPGRERRGRPGWTNPVRPAPIPPASREDKPLENPQMQEMLAEVLEALMPYPDVRLKLAARWGPQEELNEESRKAGNTG